MPETSEERPSEAMFLTANALEAVFALNALMHPELRKFLAAWAADVERQLSTKERGWLAELRKLPELYNLGDLLVRHRCFQDAGEFAAVVKRTSPDEIAALFLNDAITPERARKLRALPDGAAQVRAEHPWLWNGDERVLTTILREPEKLRAAAAGLLPRVWALGVEPMLPRLMSMWSETIAQAKSEAQGMDPKSFAFYVFTKPFARRYGPDYVFPRYLFVPTFFLSPMRVAFFPAEEAVVTMDCRLGPWAYVRARDQLAEGLRAIAEENRLEILRVLSMDKGFGGWVAKRLKLNPATVTHHMTVLRKAGLIKEVDGPAGAAKYYRADREAVERLIRLLQDYVDSAIAPGREEEQSDE